MKNIIFIMCALVCGCATSPEPFNYGEKVDPPKGCVSYTVRGGKCSLQNALDAVHARFVYTPDEKQHPEQEKTFLNGWGVDYWQLLPPSGEGDCEDFALTLRWLLNSRGIRGTHLLTVLLPGGGHHVALELDGWVMDNTSQFARPREQLQKAGWTFLSGGDESGIWRAIVVDS